MVFRQMMIGAAAAAMMVASTGIAAADTWRYAFEEAIDEVQGQFAQKFKEEVEANSDHRCSCSHSARWANPPTSWSRPRPASCSSSTSRPASPAR
jgi:hypothetical protein